MENNRPQTSPVMERENIMGTMEINPLLVKLSVPMMISMLVQALYNVVDSVFVSHVSESALTAVSLAFSLQNVMIAVGVGTGVGVNALLSKSLGEKNYGQANRAATNGLFLNVIGMLVFMVFGLVASHFYYTAQTDDPEIIAYGTSYLFIICVFSQAQFITLMLEKILVATGNTFYSMLGQMAGAITNIILDPIMIFGMFGLPALPISCPPWARPAPPLPLCWASAWASGWICGSTCASIRKWS